MRKIFPLVLVCLACCLLVVLVLRHGTLVSQRGDEQQPLLRDAGDATSPEEKTEVAEATKEQVYSIIFPFSLFLSLFFF